jgi:transketolase
MTGARKERSKASQTDMTISEQSYDEMANAIRFLAIDAVQKANSGHPGMPMGMADVATVLFSKFLKFDPANPDWPDRDRFVLSAGHGSMLLYALLFLTGYEDINLDEIKNFRQLGSRTAGHPEFGHTKGIETTTGPLGQGIATSVGMALAERIMADRFGNDLVDHYTYVIASDGDLMEGISHEAIGLAGHLQLSKLIVLFDDNGISIDGPISLSDSTDACARFEASGWATDSVDGHDRAAVEAAIGRARKNNRPTMIACKTVIGFGAPTKAGSASSHGAALGDDEVAGTREKLGWPHAPFTIPNSVLDSWRQVGGRGASDFAAWTTRHSAATSSQRDEFDRVVSGELPGGFRGAMQALRNGIADDRPKMASRKASQMVLETINEATPETIGGSADLTGSNNTKTGALSPISAEDFSGRFIHYGIREHGMAAAMNGMALHGGVIPYSGTFLIFTDYCRPAIRLSALMKQRVIYVMTHDSIGLGEDGPTHQPVEHLASLRAMPNLNVFRPADTLETAECWQLALESDDTPSVLALTRQDLPALRTDGKENRSARGAYEIASANGAADVTLFASGSEVSIAIEAKNILDESGHKARVVSTPCWELFEAQDQGYRAEVIGTAPVRVAIEAAAEFGWSRYIGEHGAFIGVRGFGVSAPYKDAYEHFGITPTAIAAKAKSLLSNQ